MSQSKRSQPPAEGGARALDYDAVLRELVRKDSRYPLEAYHFLHEAMAYSQALYRRDPRSEVEAERHLTGRELLEGVRRYAQEEFGWLAPTVFRAWGIRRTEDFGEMVFNLFEVGLMTKTVRDRREDFAGGFDFEQAFRQAVELCDN